MKKLVLLSLLSALSIPAMADSQIPATAVFGNSAQTVEPLTTAELQSVKGTGYAATLSTYGDVYSRYAQSYASYGRQYTGTTAAYYYSAASVYSGLGSNYYGLASMYSLSGY
ncbi:MAG TPA: hypothetical protein VJ548_03365 [Azospira sp.]|nr:hypothetical protein [Azospira sp.]